MTEGILYQRALPFFVAALLVASIGCGLYTSRRGKFIVWDRLLDGLNLRGDERILDLGCGRGAVLLMAATRLTTGQAVGVDLWRTRDQSGNAEEATRANAEAEGVSDRVDLQTSDLRALPFPDESFDVVLSSMAIHNVKGAEERAKAIDEAVRVLKPGGRLIIADIFAVAQYRARLVGVLLQVEQRSLGWRMWWSGPWVATSVLTATKPNRPTPCGRD